MLLTVLVFLVVVAVTKLTAVEINCEKYDRFSHVEKFCFLNEATVINVVNVTIGGLEIDDVRGINFDGNEKIHFLPVEVYKKFPNLEVYLAVSAQIQKISALNFEKLSRLKVLSLFGNRIESIPNHCFQGLNKLYKINLSTYFYVIL